MRRLLVFIWLLLILPLYAQTIPEITTYRQVLVYAGPDISYREVDVLNPGIPAQPVERNRAGTWLRVQRSDGDEVVMDGWIIAGFINQPDDLNYGDLPISDLPDAASENERSASMAALLEAAVIPTLHPAMIDVFERGQDIGRQADTVTKVGDSLSAGEQYLTVFSEEGEVLGAHADLAPTLDFYRASTANDNLAAQIGQSTYGVFDPFWASDSRCESGESPLLCDYRVHQPSIAFVLFGPNDVRSMTRDIYREQMTMLVEKSLEQGVIPVLMTFSTHPDEEFFWQSINFNLELVAISEAYHVPLINLWAAARHLPEYGLDEDRVHLAASGFPTLKYDSGHEAFYGISLQNLLVLRTLHEIRQTLDLGD